MGGILQWVPDHERSQHFKELRKKVGIYIDGHGAAKRFCKIGKQVRTFCNKKRKKNSMPSLAQTDYIGLNNCGLSKSTISRYILVHILVDTHSCEIGHS